MEYKNPEIEIAQLAKKYLDERFKRNEKLKSDFSGFMKGLPSNIIQNGLVQTVAFIKGKKSDAKYKNLYDMLIQFFKDYFAQTVDDPLDFLVDNNDIQTYLYYQQKILSFTIWLKRFVLAFYETEKSNITENA